MNCLKPFPELYTPLKKILAWKQPTFRDAFDGFFAKGRFFAGRRSPALGVVTCFVDPKKPKWTGTNTPVQLRMIFSKSTTCKYFNLQLLVLVQNV